MGATMKHALPACGIMITLISTTIIASTTFEDKKAEILSLLDQQMIILSSYKECVEAANNSEALRTCKHEQKSAIKVMRNTKRKQAQEVTLDNDESDSAIKAE